MDHRTPLKPHTVLAFEGMPCHIESVIGCGSNAIVYKGWYDDKLNSDQRHNVLIKELFPYHPKQKIYRRDDGSICIEPEAQAHWDMHQASFLEGNRVHLMLLREHPDMIGGNLNSHHLSNTLYTILDYSGGRSLLAELYQPAWNLRTIAQRMILVLDALEPFHKSGYLHLDISPDNIMLLGSQERERIFLIDFNSAHAVGATEHMYLSCKAGYTAPEVETGATDAMGFSSDLYSVAAVFFHCLMGRTLTLEEMLRPRAPRGSESSHLTQMPETVVSMVGRILKKGLHVLPDKRYQSIGQMRQAFAELIDRIDCIGVTHWALWESGRKSVDEFIRINPALRYVQEESKLYPIRILCDGVSMPLNQYVSHLLAPGGTSALITAQGGMGKTTLLLHTAMFCSRRYLSHSPAVFYIPLNGWNGSDTRYIRNQILMSLRFKREENTYDSALHALHKLLQQPLKTKSGEGPAVLLLLDGLNEIRDNTAPMIQEINELAAMAGVRILVTSRSEMPALPFESASLVCLEEEDIENALGENGVLVPRSTSLLQLLRTPLILSLYIQSSASGQQLEIETEDDLMKAYLEALLQKELQQLPEDDPMRWQIDVALNFLLPALAAQIARSGHGLTEQQLLKTVHTCWRTLRSGLLKQVFPQWIGRRASIFHGADTADAWYGIVIHSILWQHLGMLTKAQDGRYRIYHQSISDYLARTETETARKITRIRIFAWVVTCGLILILLFTGYRLLTPLLQNPSDSLVYYSEDDAEQVIDHVSVCYSVFGSRASETDELARYLQEGQIDDFLFWYDLRKSNADAQTLLSEDSGHYIDEINALCASGDQVSWSGLAFDGTSASELITTASRQVQLYADLLPLLNSWAASDRARKFCPDFPAAVSELIAADTAVMSKLYHTACYPHLENANPVWSKNVKLLVAYIPGAEKEPEETLESLLLSRRKLEESLSELVATVQAICGAENTE